MKSHRAKPNLCPYCGYFADHTSNVRDNDKRPYPGATFLCVNCGRAGYFTDDMGVRRMTDEEIDALSPKEAMMLAAVRAHCEARGPIDRTTKQ